MYTKVKCIQIFRSSYGKALVGLKLLASETNLVLRVCMTFEKHRKNRTYHFYEK